jgi:hypothetical protein
MKLQMLTRNLYAECVNDVHMDIVAVAASLIIDSAFFLVSMRSRRRLLGPVERRRVQCQATPKGP